MADDELSAVLSEFASTIITDFPIQAILDNLVERIVDVLPVTAAGVTLISRGVAPRYLAASDRSALSYETVQSELAQGPCVLAFTSGTPVLVPDLDHDHRFPLFGPRAVRSGLAAVFAFPLRHAGTPLGALDLYRDTPGPLSAAELVVAQTLADVAAAYVINALARAGAPGTRVPHEVLDAAGTHRAEARDVLEHDLRLALAEDELDVAYQPVVRSLDGVLTGVEALLRWTRPGLGPVPPDDLIRVAEQSSLIDDLGAWVLERGCRDRTRWLDAHPAAPLDLAVNVSPHQLADPAFPEIVRGVLARTRMDPAALVLEVTENAFIEDVARVGDVLVGLRALDVRVALDDFGTGYSSLSYLRGIPVDIVKIDQAFIADIGRTPGGRAIVSSVTDLAHALGLSVTAEGVETAVLRDEVRALGCDSSQGFYYSRAVTADAVSALLDSGPATGVVLPPAAA